jgi:hypothetical protein
MKTLLGRLSHKDIAIIRAEAIKFIGQSNCQDGARIEWLTTWPRKTARRAESRTVGSKGKSKWNVESHSRILQELQAVEVGQELQEVGAPGLDAIASRILEYDKRRPRALRYVTFTATSAGYKVFLRIGSPARISPRIAITCKAPGNDVPEFFRSVSELLATRATSLPTVLKAFGVWMLTILYLFMAPAAILTYSYPGFHNRSNHDNLTAEVVGLAACYLIVATITISACLHLTAARVTLPRLGGSERAFSRAARRALMPIQSALGLTRRHIALAGGAIASASLAANLAYVVATNSINARDAPNWPYILFGVLMVVGVVLYVVGGTHLRRKPQDNDAADAGERSK